MRQRVAKLKEFLAWRFHFNIVTLYLIMTTIEHLITQIEQHQPVLNKGSLSDQQLGSSLKGIGSLMVADQTQLSFLADPKYVTFLKDSSAGAVLVTEQYAQAVPLPAIALVVDNPYLAYASSSQSFTKALASNSIHPTAVIADTALIGDNVSIGAYCVIGEGVKIGDGSCLDAHVVIEPDVLIGHNCVLKSQVVIGHDCIIGNQVRLHAGVSIGAEGFGFAPTADPSTLGWERIAQLGRVIIGNHVRIGSNSCVDRGAIGDTIIADHVIIDNLVQVAHNVTIGEGTAIAAHTGIAGSTVIGKRCIIGGAVGITGHIEITDNVILSGMSMVTKSINQPGSYSSGTAAMPTAKWRRAVVRFRQMGEK